MATNLLTAIFLLMLATTLNANVIQRQVPPGTIVIPGRQVPHGTIVIPGSNYPSDQYVRPKYNPELFEGDLKLPRRQLGDRRQLKEIDGECTSPKVSDCEQCRTMHVLHYSIKIELISRLTRIEVAVYFQWCPTAS